MSGVVERRSAGVLLHPTSLPGRGVGTLGAPARRFVEWLAGAGQSYWQILPLVAVSEGGSPYDGLSAMAGNPLLVDFDDLVAEGLLSPADLEDAPGGADAVDFPAVAEWTEERFRRLHRRWRDEAPPALAADFAGYRRENADWLDDFALFRALRDAHLGETWTRWEPGLRDREPETLERWRARLGDAIERTALEQFLFDRQWTALRAHAAERGIRIVGDLPIFVAHNSADVWANRDLFRLDARGAPEVVSGVPPDYFSETGQRWGNPLYRWDVARARGWDWWIRRFERALERVDVLRVDHFRGFEASWEIPADEETAVKGRWREGPGEPLFRAVERALGGLPLIAEDLGLITEEVEALRDRLGLPGMRVLQFAFDGDARNPHRPENHVPDSIAYTGTHDNDTAAGWWRGASAQERAAVRDRAEGADPDREPHWALIGIALRSVARLAVVPLQDVLGLGSEARMNTPGTAADNWTWRFRAGDLDGAAGERLRALVEASGRLPAAAAPARRTPNEREHS